MLDHRAILAALRARLATLAVCTTGATDLSATTTGYARAAGSFLVDGFAPGMELLASGFAAAANNGRSVVTAVAALTLTVKKAGATTIEAAGAARTLAVGVPAAFGGENTDLVGLSGVPYFEETYLPGPAAVETLGPLGRMLAEPTYVLDVGFANGGAVQSTGTDALFRYAGALLLLFPPELLLTLSTGEFLHVRADEAPWQDQIERDEKGASVTVTIPLRLYTYSTV